jgi:hypothetical protein
MKTFFFITFFIFGFFSRRKEILNFLTKINKIIFKYNTHLMNKVNSFLFNFINYKLPSISFWIKVFIFIFLIQIIYQLIFTGNLNNFNLENSNFITKGISDGNSQTTSDIFNTVNNSNITVNTPGVNVPGAMDGLLVATTVAAIRSARLNKLDLKIGELISKQVNTDLANSKTTKFYLI